MAKARQDCQKEERANYLLRVLQVLHLRVRMMERSTPAVKVVTPSSAEEAQPGEEQPVRLESQIETKFSIYLKHLLLTSTET